MLIHPLVVHFPIALWLASFLFDILAWRSPDSYYRRTAYWLVGLGLLGAAASIALGWTDLFAVEAQGVGTALVMRHQFHSWAAYAATAAYLVNFLWRWRTRNSVGRALLPLALAGVALIVAAAYLGAGLREVM